MTFCLILIYFVHVKHRHTTNATQLPIKSIPFKFIVKLPPLLKTGVDYGFKASK